MEEGWQILREDFATYEKRFTGDWDKLREYKVSSQAFERLQALASVSFPFTSSPAPGLYLLSAVVQDMDSPELFSAFTLPPTSTYKYSLPSPTSQPMDDQLLTRTGYRCIPIPGSISLNPILRTVRVYMYEGEEVKVQERVDGVGMWDGEEFHLIRRTDRQGANFNEQNRGEVIRALENALGGDRLAAEFTLLCLLAMVDQKEVVVGKMVLNLTNMITASPLDTTLQQLSPAVLLPVSLQFLNHVKLTPTKNYETDCIDPTPVQVCDGTVLILDETAMEPGALTETGLQNVQVLTTVINSQEVRYDFTYHPLAVKVRVPCLIVSKVASLLPNDVRLPVSMTSPMVSCTLPSSCQAYIEAARRYTVAISDTMQQEITSAFVERRKQAPVGAEDLHRWISLARLQTRSWGRTEMTKADWDAALAMEGARLGRLEQRSN